MSKMLEVAKKAAIEAGKVALKIQKKGVTAKAKGHVDDLVTEADLESERLILKTLRNKFSGHDFISEETRGSFGTSEYTWVIDPIDGTNVFTAGLPSFAISIGLLKKGKPYLGVINMPSLNLLLWSEKSKGVFINGKRTYVTKSRDLEKSIVGGDQERIHKRMEEFKRVHKPLYDKVRYMPMFGSAVAGIAFVSIANYDAYIKTAKLWDFVAGAVAVKEAGGVVTDWEGKEIDWTKEDIDLLASNGKIHSKILRLINS